MSGGFNVYVVGAGDICCLGLLQVLSQMKEVSSAVRIPKPSSPESLDLAPNSFYILCSCELANDVIPLCKYITGKQAGAPVLVWTHNNLLNSSELLKAGASGCVGSCRASDFKKAFEAVCLGLQFFCKPASDVASPEIRLTLRQEEIRSLVLLGLSDKEIASKLGISRYTVRSHLREIFDKIGVQRRSDLMRVSFTQIAY